MPGVIQDLPTAEYRCPGESYGISRAVHLGRLAGFYAACRHCSWRNDVAGLSARQVRQLAEVGSGPGSRFLSRGRGGQASEQRFGPQSGTTDRHRVCRRLTSQATPNTRPANVAQGILPVSNSMGEPAAVVASDGRLATAAIVAAIVEGVRWTGCETIDIGPASTPCTARAIEHLGGRRRVVFVGNGHGEPPTPWD